MGTRKKGAPDLKFGKQAKKFSNKAFQVMATTKKEDRYIRKCRRAKEIPRLGSSPMGGTWGL